jgi:thiamine pyrophosphokinase
MSSHHIVRDAQEPALIIANGESCSYDLLGQLLEWSPHIVVLDGALSRVEELKIKYDVILGDFDGLDIDALTELIPPNTKIIHTPDQEKTDLEKGIEYLIKNNFMAVNIVWATGRRSDHYMNNIGTLARYKDKIHQVMIDDYSKIYPIETGFKKFYKADTNLSLIPLTKVEKLKTRNLVWNLDGEDIEYPYRTSSSNKVSESGIVSVEFQSGILLMMECLD